LTIFVTPGLDPGVHAVIAQRVEAPTEWIAGSSPAMTGCERRPVDGRKIPPSRGIDAAVTTMTQAHPILAPGHKNLEEMPC
jgi:hypothetical protein